MTKTEFIAMARQNRELAVLAARCFVTRAQVDLWLIAAE